MAKVYDFWEMWQGIQNIVATQKEAHALNKQLSAVVYIWDTEDIVKASWSLFHIMVLLLFHCQNDHLGHQLCLQMISLDYKLKY